MKVPPMLLQLTLRTPLTGWPGVDKRYKTNLQYGAGEQGEEGTARVVTLG